VGVPAELPLPLREWKKNRLSGGDARSNHPMNEKDKVVVEQQQQRNGGGARNMFVPIKVSPSVGDDNSGAGGDQASRSKQDAKRIEQMERQINSLKELVVSLTSEIKGLKDIVRKGSGPGSGGGEQVNRGVNQGVVNNGGVSERRSYYAGSGSGGGEQVNQGVNQEVTNNNGGVPERRSYYESSANDDVPNVDLEVYWGEKKGLDDSEKTGGSASVTFGVQQPSSQPRPSSSPVPPSSSSSPLPSALRRPTPPSSTTRGGASIRSALRRSTPSSSTTMNASSRPMRKRNQIQKIGMSQNIPPIHLSSGKQPRAAAAAPSRRSQSMYRSMPQSMPQSRVVERHTITPVASAHMQQVQREERFDTHAPGRTQPTRRSSGISQATAVEQTNPVVSTAKGTADNLAPQMKQVQREERFDTHAPGRTQPTRRSSGISQATAVEQTNPVVSAKAGTEDNPVSQMKQVQREDRFDTLMQRTIENIKPASSTGSVNSNTSSRNSRATPTGPSSSFQPAQLSRPMLNPRQSFANSRRPSRLVRRSSLVDSCRHITRRSSGESEIYNAKAEPRSTAAVDLAPL